MDVDLERLVTERARHCCEYCRMPQEFDEITLEFEHVIPRKHGGLTAADNLALACFFCNNRKGPNLSGIDPETGEVVQLFDHDGSGGTDIFGGSITAWSAGPRAGGLRSSSSK